MCVEQIKTLWLDAMSDNHNKLQDGNDYNHGKILDLALDLDFISFSKPNPNPTHLPKPVEYDTVNAHTVWSQKFRLTPELKKEKKLSVFIGDVAQIYLAGHKLSRVTNPSSQSQLIFFWNKKMQSAIIFCYNIWPWNTTYYINCIINSARSNLQVKYKLRASFFSHHRPCDWQDI